MRARIGLNALALRPIASGVQTYIRELLSALPAAVADVDLVAMVQSDVVDTLPPGIRAIGVRPGAGLRRTWHGLRPFPEVELVHGLNVAVPMIGNGPSVATMHDLSVFDAPWAFPRAAGMAKRVLYRSAARAADAIIADSAFTAERVRAVLGVDAVPVPLAAPSDCVPASADQIDDVRRRYELPEQFVLHVGTLDPRKDVPLLARACQIVGVPLVLAGARGRDAANLHARLLDYVARADLLAIYGAATVVAYSSRYEGYGLPVAEAMACGAPIVTTDVASVRELVGDAGVIVAPGDEHELVEALRGMCADSAWRAELRAEGLARASARTWNEVARETADVYRSVGLSG